MIASTFGDNGLSRISLEHRSEKIEQRWKLNVGWPWNHDISEADIDLHRNSRFRQHRVEADSDALVVRVLLDSGDLDGIAIEFDSVRLGDYVAHRSHEFLDVAQLVTCPAGKIDVEKPPSSKMRISSTIWQARRAIGRARPEVEKNAARCELGGARII